MPSGRTATAASIRSDSHSCCMLRNVWVISDNGMSRATMSSARSRSIASGVGWRRVLAGEAEQGRGEHVLGERSNGRPRCERVVNLPVQCGEGLFHGAGHPPGCAVSQAGP